MASKMKPARLESEIERCREEANWKKALDLILQSSGKYPELEKLTDFVMGESKLEEFLMENVPSETSISVAKSTLGEADTSLTRVANSDSKLKVQAQLLLVKLQYCQGNYQGALAALDRLDLDRITAQHVKLPARLLTILAETYAVKGLCLEKTQPASSSRFRMVEHEEKILTCFEHAGDLALVSLQERENSSLSSSVGLQPPEPRTLGPILEQAIQQSPILYIKHGELNKGIKRYRELLRSVESRVTHGVRQVLARQLAEVLLRGVCENTYIPLDMSPPSASSFPRPKFYSSDRLFVPEDENEETLLLLLIAEAIATRDAVLDRTAEVSETRNQVFQNITAIYDLLALGLVKRAQFFMLADSFERAMRFSFDEFHVWHQFANSLICAGKHARAVRVLQECHRLRPESTLVCLQAARLCFEYLHQYAEGVKWAERAMAVGEGDALAARAHLALGIGHAMHAMEVHLLAERQQLHRKALTAFQKSHQLDPADYLTLFHLALQLAILRRISEALTYVKLALKYRNDHIHSLHLLVLLLTAQNQMEEAMVLLHAALEEYPDNLSLLLTKSKLEEILSGPEEALNTCKKMMKLWKDMHEIDSEDGSEKKAPGMDRNTLDRRSLAQLTMNEFSERGSGSIRAESVAASRVERALSEVASSMNSSFQQRPGSQQSWMLQAQIWLHLAELYLCLNKVSEAEACVTETSTIFPLSHQVYYMKGQVYEHKQKFHEAKVCYENAVALNPGHTKSLQRLGNVLHQLGDDKMAEKVLRDAVNADPTSHKSWYSLGTVLESRGQMEAAGDCLSTAADLQSTAPIVPFTVIPRLMQ